MYITYDELFQFGLLIVAIIGLVLKASHKDTK
ncbi:MAG: putative holin-like toxin [Lachnospiraceae bacterium]|nr:putative holin-like toxin [Lachnospiraceae bacterium]